MTILRLHLGFWFSVLGLVTEIWRKIIFRLLLTNSIFFFPFFAPEWACGLSHILWKDFRARLSVLAIIRFGMSPSPMRKVSRNLEDWSKSHCDAVPSAWHEYRLWQGSWKERNRKEVTKSWTSSWLTVWPALHIIQGIKRNTKGCVKLFSRGIVRKLVLYRVNNRNEGNHFCFNQIKASFPFKQQWSNVFQEEAEILTNWVNFAGLSLSRLSLITLSDSFLHFTNTFRGKRSSYCRYWGLIWHCSLEIEPWGDIVH